MQAGTQLRHLFGTATFKFVRAYNSKYWIVENQLGKEVRMPSRILVTQAEVDAIRTSKMKDRAARQARATAKTVVLEPVEPEKVEEPKEKVVTREIKKPPIKSKIKEKIQKVVKNITKKKKKKK